MNRHKGLFVVVFSVVCLALYHNPVFVKGSTTALNSHMIDAKEFVVVGANIQAVNIGTNVTLSQGDQKRGAIWPADSSSGNRRIARIGC
jgi:hypothetical protein